MSATEKAVAASLVQVPPPRSNGRFRRAVSPAPRLSPSERAAVGESARSRVPHEAHGEFRVAVGRPDPVQLLVSQGETRVTELLPIRYGRMLVSPFTFYRGAALVMAHDLAMT